ncbi:MAG: hypothetical protein SNH27_17225 [Rikenellaceae bacterium]
MGNTTSIECGDFARNDLKSLDLDAALRDWKYLCSRKENEPQADEWGAEWRIDKRIGLDISKCQI